MKQPRVAGSASQALDVRLSRIARFNAALNAVVTLDAQRARTMAQAADREVSPTAASLPLAGSIVTIKDSFETAGLRTTCGASQWSSHVPARNADAVQRLIDAGCVVVGKTNVPIYTTDLQTYNTLFGTTVNPWDALRTCGGSSGGAAVAVACGLTDFELGSDIGGSIRIPAHFCGIYGHKPTYGRVPLRGHIPPPPGSLAVPDLAVAGPLARSADDLARVLRVLAPDLPESPPRTLSACRIAVCLDDPAFPVDDQVRDVLERAVDRMAKSGVRVTRARPLPSLREVADNYLKLLWPVTTAHLSARAVQRMIERGHGEAPDSPHAKLARYATATHREWLVVQEWRERLRQHCREFFSDHDLLLMPVGPVTAFAHDHSDDLIGRRIVINGEMRWYWEQLAWIALATTAYLPATVAPAGRAADGLPVGLQIIGPEAADQAVIGFARAVAPVLGGFVAAPGYE